MNPSRPGWIKESSGWRVLVSMESVEHQWSGARTRVGSSADVERRIERIYRERLESFVRVAAAITGDRVGAADVVQEGFARAFAHAPAFRGECPLEGWVWRIVVNEARRPRAARAGPSATDPSSVSAPSTDVGWLRSKVSALPERQRLALFLRYYADLDYEAIGAAMGVASGTVAATLSHAHANLRRMLEEADDGV